MNDGYQYHCFSDRRPGSLSERLKQEEPDPVAQPATWARPQSRTYLEVVSGKYRVHVSMEY